MIDVGVNVPGVGGVGKGVAAAGVPAGGVNVLGTGSVGPGVSNTGEPQGSGVTTNGNCVGVASASRLSVAFGVGAGGLVGVSVGTVGTVIAVGVSVGTMGISVGVSVGIVVGVSVGSSGVLVGVSACPWTVAVGVSNSGERVITSNSARATSGLVIAIETAASVTASLRGAATEPWAALLP